MGLDWHCARTKHAQEQRAAIGIASQGFPVFLPLKQTRICHAGKCEMLPRPLFARYIFVQFDRENDPWGPINHTRGVSRLLADAQGFPSPIKPNIIEAIRKRETENRLNSGALRSGYEPGDPLILQVGPYAGLQAVYFGEDHGKATIGISLFGRELMHEIPLAKLPPRLKMCA